MAEGLGRGSGPASRKDDSVSVSQSPEGGRVRRRKKPEDRRRDLLQAAIACLAEFGPRVGELLPEFAPRVSKLP